MNKKPSTSKATKMKPGQAEKMKPGGGKPWPISKDYKCSHCGAPMNQGMHVCPNCGVKKGKR